MDSAADVHVCNNQRLMIEYSKKSRRVGKSIADGISPIRKKIKIRLTKKDGSEGLVLTLTNVIDLANSPSNLVSF